MTKLELKNYLEQVTNSITTNKSVFAQGRTFDINNNKVFNFIDTVIHLFPLTSKITFKDTNSYIEHSVNIAIFKLHEKGINRSVISDNKNLHVIEEVLYEFINKIINDNNGLTVNSFDTVDYPIYNESSYVVSAILLNFKTNSFLDIPCV